MNSKFEFEVNSYVISEPKPTEKANQRGKEMR